MSKLFDRRKTIATISTLLLVFSLSSLAFASSDQHGRRGPVRANYRDRDDDDRRWGDWNRGEIRRRAISFGSRIGFEAGRRDRVYHRSFNFRNEQAYQVASAGYRRNLGSLELYRRIFREAFAQAYVQGYRGGLRH